MGNQFDVTNILDSIFYLLLIILCVNDFIVSIKVLFLKKKPIFMTFLLFWPLIIVIKVFSKKQYNKIMERYYSRVHFFSVLGVTVLPLLVVPPVISLLSIWK